MFNIGICYANGQGVPRNQTLAVQWLQQRQGRYAPAAKVINEIKLRNLVALANLCCGGR